MKNRNVFIGGLAGGLLLMAVLFLIQVSNGDWSGAPGLSELLLYLGICFAPGFAAGAIGAHALTRAKPQHAGQQTSNLGRLSKDTDDTSVQARLSKGIFGGIAGVIALAVILLIFLLIMGYMATSN